MKFSDCGIIIDVKKYGEKSLIVKIFSENHGVCRGFIKFANSKKFTNIFQIGNLVSFEHHARIEDSLGGFSNIDLIDNNCAKFIFDKLRTNCAKSIISIVNDHFLEIENFNLLFNKLANFLQNLGDEKITNSQIIANYIKLELLILEGLGYGIDFSCCVVSNSKINLAFVSPKSAHAVSYEAGLPYANKLLKLPPFLNLEFANQENNDEFLVDYHLVDGLNLSGYFLNKYLFIDSKKNNFSSNFYRENILKIVHKNIA